MRGIRGWGSGRSLEIASGSPTRSSVGTILRRPSRLGDRSSAPRFIHSAAPAPSARRRARRGRPAGTRRVDEQDGQARPGRPRGRPTEQTASADRRARRAGESPSWQARRPAANPKATPLTTRPTTSRVQSISRNMSKKAGKVRPISDLATSQPIAMPDDRAPGREDRAGDHRRGQPRRDQPGRVEARASVARSSATYRAEIRPARMKPVSSGARLRIRPTPDDRADPVDEGRAEVGLHRQERAHPDVDQGHRGQAHPEQPVELPAWSRPRRRSRRDDGRTEARRAEVARSARRPR